MAKAKKTRNKTESNPQGAGRPKLDFDINIVKGLAKIQCTEEEIASVLGCSVDTITRRIQDNPDFADAIKSGRSFGKMSIRRMQYGSAEKGSVAMLIWLGKQYLGQKEKVEYDDSDATKEIRFSFAPPNIKEKPVIKDEGEAKNETDAEAKK
jgi:hypothetical protein